MVWVEPLTSNLIVLNRKRTRGSSGYHRCRPNTPYADYCRVAHIGNVGEKPNTYLRIAKNN